MNQREAIDELKGLLDNLADGIIKKEEFGQHAMHCPVCGTQLQFEGYPTKLCDLACFECNSVWEIILLEDGYYLREVIK